MNEAKTKKRGRDLEAQLLNNIELMSEGKRERKRLTNAENKEKNEIERQIKIGKKKLNSFLFMNA